jgi:hypothetical protein
MRASTISPSKPCEPRGRAADGERAIRLDRAHGAVLRPAVNRPDRGGLGAGVTLTWCRAGSDAALALSDDPPRGSASRGKA